MLSLYDWQEADATWLSKQNSLLASDCGTGKTLIAVESAKRYAKGPILVIAPRLTKEWWKQTILDQEGGIAGICGPAGRGIAWGRIASRKGGPLLWVITHPEAIRISYRDIARVKWDTVIVDEAHRFKNRNALQTKALQKIKARWKILLTATPWGKSPADMWALLHYMYPQAYRSYWRFHDDYVEDYKPPNKGFTIILGPKNLPKLAKEVAPVYRKRKKSDVLTKLPPITYSDVPVVINGKQAQLYEQLIRDAYAELVGKEIILENALVKFIRLQQCALDPALMAEGLPALPLETNPAKVEWVFDWLEDHPEEPVIITSRYRKFVEKWLRDLAPKAVIVGGMKTEAVQAALREFQHTGRLVGSLDAIKEGLNLQRASTMINTDGTWSSTAEYQLSQRIHRVGQTRSCQVIHLVAKTEKRWTVDRLMRRAVEHKFSNAKLVDSFIKELQDA